jgi:S-adenosylmethionine-diacylglycerol 3-amino-3-carboxypropyl transferase
MTDLAPIDLAPRIAERHNGGKNQKLRKALIQHKPLTASGLSERLFGLLFSGLVYPQIWEDPAVDMAAMQIRPEHHIVTIGSGGCNMLAYLSAMPERIDVVDLNRHHVALNRLKLAAFRHLPAHADLVRFLAREDLASNIAAYDRFIAPHLDVATRAYWESRRLNGRRRIQVFGANLYRTGLLGRFIWLSHMLARAHGVDPAELTATRSLREQRQFFDERLAPLFDRPVIRWLTGRKSSLFGLGIPPQQFDELASLSAEKSLAPVLKQRLEKLVCHFPLRHNYFAWQAFGRRYPLPQEGLLPLHLQPEAYDAIRENAERVHVHHESFTDLLARKADGSVDRYVLLDAQDWMTDGQLDDLWTEITRTAAPNAVVIFRTAAERSILDGRLSDSLLGLWTYDREPSEALNLKDRSAIYGGFHIYRRKP